MVVPGARVEIAPGGLGLSCNGADAPAARPLEEHVLQDVRDTGPSVRLVEEAGLHMGHHRNDWRRVIRLDEQGKTVGEDFAEDSGGPER